MNKLITLMLFIFSINVSAVEVVDENVIKNVGDIHSITFENNQSITVYLPDGYKHNKANFSVMYVIDGDKYFLNSIAYQKTLTWQEKVPAFIVVGINIENKKRRELLGDKSLEFIDIFQNQIVRYVDKHYRTNDIRMYFGWEMAGGFALDLFSKQPNLIDAYFLASSTYFTPQRLDSVNDALKNKSAIAKFFYYTLGDVETWAISSHNALDKILKNNAKKNFQWEFYLSTNDDHYTTPLDTFNKGLTQYFNGYSPKRFYSIKEFEDFGGIPALKEHYKNRGERFHVSTSIHDDTKHYLLNQSINENDFENFKMLVAEFEGFIEGNNYSTGFIIKISQFYVDNGAVNDAIHLYKSELLKNPKSQELVTELNELNKITKKI
jgi:predicted alpha/beta superfamily hydrolase